MRKAIMLFTFLSVIALAACGGEKVEPTMSTNVGDFSATTQDNQEITNEDLLGEWWVADFIFTKCTTICPPMTRNMTIVQKRLGEFELNDKVQLISFSVDPENDTPEVLTDYAEEHGADLNNWSFLTGYDFDTIQDISVKYFQSGLEPPMPGDDQVGHGTRFFLVDPEGNVYKSYIGTDSEQIDELVQDVSNLVE